MHEHYAEKKVRKEIDTCNNNHHLQPHLQQNENGQLKISKRTDVNEAKQLPGRYFLTTAVNLALSHLQITWALKGQPDLQCFANELPVLLLDQQLCCMT